MRSDKSAYYTYKYLPFLFGAFFILASIFMHIFPEGSTVNGEPGPPDVWLTVMLILVGIVICLTPFLYMDKLVLVELGNEHIDIRKSGKVVPVEWVNIKKVTMVPFLFPPLYKLRLNNYDGYFLFNTRQYGAHFLFFTWDWSDMGKLIRKKKRDLNI